MTNDIVIEFDTGPFDEEELKATIAKKFMEKWKTSHDYFKVRPVEFSSNEMDKKVLMHSEFMPICYYATFLMEKMLEFNFTAIRDDVRQEILEWDGNGGLCLYVSILVYCLMIDRKIVAPERLKLVQGYYIHPTYGILSIFDNMKIQSGLHAFLLLDEKIVIDLTINQEACVFDFKGYDFILGELPEEMRLAGWCEGKNLVKEYAREIARGKGLYYFDWLENHFVYALDVTINDFKGREIEVGRGRQEWH